MNIMLLYILDLPRTPTIIIVCCAVRVRSVTLRALTRQLLEDCETWS